MDRARAHHQRRRRVLAIRKASHAVMRHFAKTGRRPCGCDWHRRLPDVVAKIVAALDARP